MSKRFGLRTVLTSAALVAGLAASAVTAGAASASTTGHDHGLKPQTFKLVQVTDSHGNELVNVLTARGPIRGTGTDQQVNDNLDVFVFPAGTVNVAHKATADSQPKFNLKACTATFTEDGTFQLKGGTGKYAHASGYGRYHLNGLLVLQRKHHKCDTNMNDAPKLTVIKIRAAGKATIGHHHR